MTLTTAALRPIGASHRRRNSTPPTKRRLIVGTTWDNAVDNSSLLDSQARYFLTWWRRGASVWRDASHSWRGVTWGWISHLESCMIETALTYWMGNFTSSLWGQLIILFTPSLPQQITWAQKSWAEHPAEKRSSKAFGKGEIIVLNVLWNGEYSEEVQDKTHTLPNTFRLWK